MEYKSPYLSSYVQPKVIMKTLLDLCNTPIYKEAKVSIKKDWANLFESNKIIEENELPIFFNVIFNKHNMDQFEEVVENTSTYSLVQFKKKIEQIFDQVYETFIFVAPSEEFQPLGLFQDVKCEKYNYPTLFFGKARSFELQLNHSYQKFAKA